ncbi:MAG: TolB family protein [Solirubrobacterales bacterium]
MNVDDRGREAAGEVRRAFASTGRFLAPVELERLHDERLRRARHQRWRAGLVAAGITIVAVVLLVSALRDRSPVVPANRVPTGTVLYGRWNARTEHARWFTSNVDGSDVRDLGLTATCARWIPGGTDILITNDVAFSPDHPLRPAIVHADGSDKRPLEATKDPSLNLGCGDVSPDGRSIVLEGFTDDGSQNGIYLVRASDGGGLRAVSESAPGESIGDPVFSPDGTRIAFFRTKAGVSPQGAGAIFTIGVDGSNLRRITPWGGAFLDQSWSPDGQWIIYQRPYGVLTMVHPDGSDPHDVPLTLPPGSGAQNPSWSPDGAWIVFSLSHDGIANIYMVRPDGTSLTRITTAVGVDEQHPIWTSAG